MKVVRERLACHVDRVIDSALARERLVGVVVLIASDGEIVYSRAAGWADREVRRAMSEDVIFRLASVTKPIVSAAALALVDQGVISLEDPVAKWLPRFRPRLADGREPVITIRHLMTHTSGLDYGFQPGGVYQSAGVSNGMDAPGMSAEEALRRLASVPLLFEPGTAWTYSLATDVLGWVMASAANAPLPAIVRRCITAPLRMSDTDFGVRDPARLAVPYVDGMPHPKRMEEPCELLCPLGLIRFSPARILDSSSYPSGGAGMAGTAADVLKLLEAIRTGGGAILSAASAERFTTSALPQGLHTEPGWTFSLAAGVLRDRELAHTPHDTGTWRWGGGYGHELFVNPQRRLSVVSLTNTTLEGCEGTYPKDLRDAIYYALTVER